MVTKHIQLGGTRKGQKGSQQASTGIDDEQKAAAGSVIRYRMRFAFECLSPPLFASYPSSCIGSPSNHNDVLAMARPASGRVRAELASGPKSPQRRRDGRRISPLPQSRASGK